ncbi:PREDICTED: uncharacterized protein C22orf15 homolog [Hipposideros armiger]|uniref:Uncharacterized protein C22orf15 homolog n=1 Tax=Hipposideros armiger TaxID=186990 RepID=A0A8B7TAE3_HIPAR|nr:PREDICTED: uncharacterized protein C22orf15 homolog [Hipposideros armiger]
MTGRPGIFSPATMFITVLFGAGCRELVNPWCSLVILTAHLRKKGQVPPDATIALLAEDGHLVNLEKGLQEASQDPATGSPLLQERGTYVLVQIINEEGGAFTRYESLLENLDDWCPELAGPVTGHHSQVAELDSDPEVGHDLYLV